MKSMVKVRVAGNRLSVGSWSIPFARNSSPPSASDGTTATSKSEKRQSRLFSSTSAASTSVTSAPATPITSVTPTATSEARKTSLMIELAQTITRETEKLNKYLDENGLPQPGFGVDAPLQWPKLSGEVKKAREEVLRATKELGDLVTGPTEVIRWMAWDHNNSLSLHAIYHYRIAASFPATETTTFATIAASTGLSELNTRRFLRHAITNRIFCEPSPGIIAHTAASIALASSPSLQDWLGFCVADMWPAASRTIAALEAHPQADDMKQTGFCVANGTVDKEPMFMTIGKDPLRARRFGGAMVSLTGGEGYELEYLLKGYDWTSLNAKSAKVVDLGGSHGFVCVALAELYPNLTFVIQDLPKMIASAPTLDGEIGERIVFQAHDFNTAQPIKGADIYFFRWILHNHSDKYAVNMLRQLIPALKKGAKVLINDHCLREPGEESGWDEKIMRTMDLVMLTLLNAQERSEVEFRELFGKADEGFKFVGVRREEGCRMSLVEAVWEGEDYGGSVEEVVSEEGK